MARIIETTLYQFSELSPEAQENARDWYRQGIESWELSDSDYWQEVAKILGIEFKTRSIPLMNGKTRQEPCIYWRGFSNQGDGASWHGWYSYAKQAPARIRAYAPQDTKLHRIADELQALQRPHFYRLQCTVTNGPGSNFYSHSGTMACDTSRVDGADCDDSLLTDAMCSFADWIYRQLESQWEYLYSDESVDESIACNGYEFTESGEIA